MRNRDEINYMENWVEICTAVNMMEAYLIKGRLESMAIPVMLKYEAAGQLYGITVDGLSEVRIFVPKELEQEAVDIIDDIGGIGEE